VAPAARPTPRAGAVRNLAGALTLWGLLAGLLTALVLLVITPRIWPTIDGRGAALRASTRVLENGGPLLVGRHGAHGAYYAIEKGDDEGEYVYVPLLSRLFGVADPLIMFRYLYIALVAMTAALYPTIIYRLTRSVLAAIASPAIFAACTISMGFTDIYWLPAWGALTLLPVVFLLARDWPKLGSGALMGIALIAGWMSSIRSDSGLGIAIAALIVLLVKQRRRWLLPLSVAGVIVAYISVSTFVFSAIRAERDHRIGPVAAKSIEITTAHSLWHTAYAGIGYLRNSYGLHFSDAVPYEAVQHLAPGTVFLSRRYEALVRKAFWGFVRRHPLEVIRQYAAKLLVTIADTAPYGLIVLLTWPAMLLVDPARRLARRWALLAVPMLVVALSPVMLAMPQEEYEQGLYGVLGALGIVGLCEALRRLEFAVDMSSGVRSIGASVSAAWGASSSDSRRYRKSARFAAGALATLVLLSTAGYFVRRDADRWQGYSSGVLMEYIGGRLL
jgi:hypothetical protein